MDEIQIKRLLVKDEFTKNNFAGVYARTHVTLTHNLPAIYVINLDNYGAPGFHWIAVYVNEKIIYIFDSFGGNFLNDSMFASFIQYCRKYNQKIISSPIAIQSPFGSTCGLYCVLFAMIISRGYSFSDFIKIFQHNDPKVNDQAIITYFEKHYNIVLN